MTQARAAATQIKLSAADLSDPAKLRAFEQAQGQLSQSLGRRLAVSERYPDLKANASFRDLQSQREGRENRITVERRRYNEAIQRYNTRVRAFPGAKFALPARRRLLPRSSRTPTACGD